MARTHRILEILKQNAPNDMSFAEVRDEYVKRHPDDFVRIDQIGSALVRMVKVGFAIERTVPGSYRWKPPAEKRPAPNTVKARHEKINAAVAARHPWNQSGPPSERLGADDELDDKLLGSLPAASPDWGVGMTGPAYGTSRDATATSPNSVVVDGLTEWATIEVPSEALESSEAFDRWMTENPEIAARIRACLNDGVAERLGVDPVNHPPHYGGVDNPYEAIKVIEAWDLGFNLGNTVKYVARAGKKVDQHGVTQMIIDLEKAAWYLTREIERLRR